MATFNSGNNIFKKKNVQTNVQAASPSSSTRNSTQSSNTAELNNNSSAFSYFDMQETTIKKGNTVEETLTNFSRALAERNEKQKANKKVHGMSDAEYAEYRQYMFDNYRITLEQGYNYGDFQNVAVAMGESCSNGVRFSAACKTAQSMDSPLDLIAVEKFKNATAEIFHGDTDPNWDRILAARNIYRKKYGIDIVECSDRQYSISLIDKNGYVIQDSDGHLAQFYTNDMLLPDGLAQQNEVQIAAALDAMGFDCWSVMDLSSEEYDMIKEMAELDNSQLGTSSRFKGDCEYKIREEVLGSYDKSTGRWTKAKIQDNNDWLHGEYIDKVTGKKTGAVKRYSQFRAERESGFYRGKTGYDGTSSGIEGVSGYISSSSYSSPNNSDAANQVIREMAQSNFNDLVDDLLWNNDSMTLEEAIKEANETLHTEDMNLEYTGDKHSEGTEDNQITTKSNKKAAKITNYKEAQYELNKYVELTMIKYSNLTLEEATKKGIKELEIEKYHLKYSGTKEKTLK